MGFWEALGMRAEAEPDASFTVDIPPEMMEAMTAGGAIAPRVSRASRCRCRRSCGAGT